MNPLDKAQIEELKRLAEKNKHISYHTEHEDLKEDVQWLTAANPQTILSLIARLESLEAKLEATLRIADHMPACINMSDFEKDARNWQLLDHDNRSAQHFWEGGLEMRRQIAVRLREALAKLKDGAE